MDRIGFRAIAIAIVLLLGAVLPLRLALADQSQEAEDELALVAESALIAEIFGDNQEAQEWNTFPPRFALEMRLVDRILLAVVDDVKLQVNGCVPLRQGQVITVNGEMQLHSSGASENCE